MKTIFEPPKSVFDRYEKAAQAFSKASTAAQRAQMKARDAEQEKRDAQEAMWTACLEELHRILPHWRVRGAPCFELECVFGFLPTGGIRPTAAILSYSLRREEVTICTRERFISTDEIVPFERAIEDLKKIGVTFD